jgi:dihydroceramidase
MTAALQALLTAVLTALVAALTLALLQVLGPDWTRFLPATCLASHCFCELPRTGDLLLQPANSWSSFGFVGVGLWIMLGARNSPANARPVSALAGLAAGWFGFTAIVIGIGSVALHASLTLWGQFADVLGMYLLGSFTLAWAVMRWRGLSPAAAIALYVLVAGGLIGALWVWPETRRWLFAVLLVTAIAVEWWLARPRRPGVNSRLLLCGLAANALAFAIWIADQAGTLCAPASPWQGHAAWHLLGAAALACSHGYYRSEIARKPRVAAHTGL